MAWDLPLSCYQLRNDRLYRAVQTMLVAARDTLLHAAPQPLARVTLSLATLPATGEGKNDIKARCVHDLSL